MARLIVTTAGREEETLELGEKEVVSIGREASNRLALPDDTRVSRRHCRIGPREDGGQGWEVVDLGSTNKTRVNGAAVGHRVLTHGDVIEVGEASLRFEDPEEERRLEEAGRQGICYLEWVNREHKGRKVMLSGARTTLGRRPTNDVVLDDRMVSGHHCEVLRDVNGYTVRDLGSTNGTLVNGEPVSDALLVHGNRVRIGNGRFVFKDPSMRDVEVELAHFDEDEGWGMMGEIDLARSRGSKASLLATFLLVVALGGGAYLLTRPTGEPSEAAAAAGGLVQNGDFEEAEVLWRAEREGTARVVRSPLGETQHVLRLSHQGEGGASLVTYAEAFPVTPTGAFRIAAEFRGGAGESGEAPELVLVWRLVPTTADAEVGVLPMTRVETLAVARSGLGPVAAYRVPPAWASEVRLAVWLPPGARATLDDVTVLTETRAEEPVRLEVPVGKTAHLDVQGYLDLQLRRNVLLAGAGPVARLEDGRVLTRFQATGAPQVLDGGVRLEGRFLDGDPPLAASVRWERTDSGLRATVDCEGASAAGLAASLPTPHLEGELRLLGDFPPQRLPTDAGQRLEGVARAMAGNPKRVDPRPPTLLALLVPGEQPVATLEVVASRDAGLTRLRFWLPPQAPVAEVVSDFRAQEAAAHEALAAANQMAGTAPGRAIGAFRRVAETYPFDEETRNTAQERARELEQEAREALDGLEQAVAEYRIYGSREALDEAHRRAEEIRVRFPGGPDARGALEGRAAELVSEVAAERAAFEAEQAAPEIDRLLRLVDLLADAEGYRPMAALYARAALDRFGHLAEAVPDVARRLDDVRERLQALLEVEGVREALPPGPP